MSIVTGEKRHFRIWLLSATALGLCPATAWAQQAPVDQPAPASQTAGPAGPATDASPDVTASADTNESADIIVTGTSRARIALDTPLAVTTIGQESLTRLQASGQADILNSVPTIKADGGGGEVAANVFVKGLPSGGQYQFTPLEYDGIPVLSTFGLNSSAFDVYYRNDLGIDRLEFVRGGVSNLFGPGSVAGLINYITRSGTDELRGTAQLEVAERGRYRGDLAVSGPISDNLFYAFSGYYRSDDGPIKTNLNTRGYQVRGNLKYAFPDDSGSITLYGQYIDDQVQFYLPIPLDGTTRNRIPGNDGKKVFSVQNKFPLAGLGFNTPDGPFVSQISDGVTTKGGEVALAFDKKFGDGWGINGRGKYSQYAHKFGLWSDGDGIINVPETLGTFLRNRQAPPFGTASAGIAAQFPELQGVPLANASYTFVGGGTVPANFLLFANRFTDRKRPVHDYTGELNLTKQLTTGSVEHSFTLGGFYANATARDFTVTTTYLAEFNNRPRLVNLTVTNPVTGVRTIISRNGLLNAGAGYTNNRHQVERYAGYIADQMEIGDRFNLDIGARVEHYNGDISRERVSTTITDATTPNLSAALRDVIWGNDGFLTGKVSTTEWAAAIGALYKLTDRVSLYANASRGYFFPELRAVGFLPPLPTPANASGSPPTQSFTGEIIKQAEAGIKVSQPLFSFTAAALYTKLDNRRQVLFVNAPGGGFQELVNIVATRSYGVEGTLDLKLLDNLHFNGNITLQNHRYTRFDAFTAPGVRNPAVMNVGHNLERQPFFLYNAGLYYDDSRLDASFFTNYTDDNFTAANNTILLKGWNVANFDAGYRFALFGGGKTVRLGINIFNVFNTDATTEGSPRQDANQTVGGAYFVGRPVLPRRVTGRLTFNF